MLCCLVVSRRSSDDALLGVADLNSMDNQGIRYKLSTLLLDQHDSAMFEQLLGRYPDDTLLSGFTNHALFLFRASGDSAAARVNHTRPWPETNTYQLIYWVQKSSHEQSSRTLVIPAKLLTMYSRMLISEKPQRVHWNG